MHHVKLEEEEEEEKHPNSNENQLDIQHAAKSISTLATPTRITAFMTIEQELSAIRNLKWHFLVCGILPILAFLPLSYQAFEKPGMNFVLDLVYLLTTVIYLYAFFSSWSLETEIGAPSGERKGSRIESLYGYLFLSIYSVFLVLVPVHTVIIIFGAIEDSVFCEYMNIQSSWISYCAVLVSSNIVLDTVFTLRYICKLGILKETVPALGTNYALGVLNISLIGFYYIFTIWNYWEEYAIEEIFDVKGKPIYMLLSAIEFICAVLLSLYLFTTGDCKLMKYCCVGYFIIGALGLLPSVYFTYSTSHLNPGFEEKCVQAIQSVDHNYLKSLGCSKYTDTAVSDDMLSCPKYLITYIWDERESDSYGCLNIDCCDVYKKDVVFKVYLLNSCLIAIGLLISTSSILFWYNAKLLSRYEYRRITHQNMPLVILVLVLIAFGGIFASLLPSISLSFDPHTSLKSVVYNIGEISSPLITQEYCIPLNTFKFPNCTDTAKLYSYLEVELDITHLKGKLTSSLTPKYIKYEEKELQIYRFNKCKEFEEIKEDMEFCSQCPLDEQEVNYDIKGYQEGETEGNMIYSNARNAVLSGNHLVDIGRKAYSTELNLESNDLQDVDFIGSMDGCTHSISGKTQQDGQFHISIPLTYDLSPFNYNLRFSKEGYYYSDIVAHIGGLPLGFNTLPDIPMVPYTPNTSNLQIYGQVNHIILQTPVSDVLVELRLGYNNSTGPVHSVFLTNSTGWFEFVNLSPGLYTLKAYKSGFFSDIREVILKEAVMRTGLMISDQDITKDNIRITLTWKSNIDLDIHARFKVSTNYYCDVNFSARKCGGTILESISSDGYLGGESILVKHGSLTDYLFYVKAFGKEQDGKDNAAIFHSEAIVSVYVIQMVEPVVRLTIPIEYKWSSEDGGWKVWAVMCMSGENGVESVLPTQIFLPSTDTDAINTMCSNLYGTILNRDTLKDTIEHQATIIAKPLYNPQ